LLIAAPGCSRCQDLIREWRRAAKEEVDFQLEAKNALQASKALRRNSVDVVCPEPLQDLCSQRVLTMVFIEGWKITDLDRMPYGADREGLARNLVHAFALLVFEEGLIHIQAMSLYNKFLVEKMRKRFGLSCLIGDSCLQNDYDYDEKMQPVSWVHWKFGCWTGG